MKDNRSLDDERSLINEALRNMESLLLPPEIEIPTKEVNQRSSFSGLADGSILDPGNSAPVGESLDKAMVRLSRMAAEAWEAWTNPDNELLGISESGVPIEALKLPLEKALLTESEQILLTRLRRLSKVEDTKFKRSLEARHKRAIEESGFVFKEQESKAPISNRFFNVTTREPDGFGSFDEKVKVIDRCDGNDKIKKVTGISVSNIEPSFSNPSVTERNEFIKLTYHETFVWRKSIRPEQELYLPNVGMDDDPDFINPLSLKDSKNFNIYPPASRPYDIVFKLWYDQDPQTGKFRRVKKLYPKAKPKDYTSLSSMVYLIKSKYSRNFELEIDTFKGSKKKDSDEESDRPNCKFEIDLRVSYNDEGVPHPTNYKKVDPMSVLGQKLLLMLNQQPYLFSEYSWEWEEPDKQGNLTKEKKLVVGISYPANDKLGKRCYWVYLDRSKNPTSKIKLFRKKIIYPQIRYFTLDKYPKYMDLPNYERVSLPLTASVRVSDNAFYFSKEQGKYINFPEIVENFTAFLASKGYLFVSSAPESPFTNVLLYKFIHNSMVTKQQRKQAYQSLRQ